MNKQKARHQNKVALSWLSPVVLYLPVSLWFVHIEQRLQHVTCVVLLVIIYRKDFFPLSWCKILHYNGVTSCFQWLVCTWRHSEAAAWNADGGAGSVFPQQKQSNKRSPCWCFVFFNPSNWETCKNLRLLLTKGKNAGSWPKYTGKKIIALHPLFVCGIRITWLRTSDSPVVPLYVSRRVLLALADPVISPPPPAHLEAISQSPRWAQIFSHCHVVLPNRAVFFKATPVQTFVVSAPLYVLPPTLSKSQRENKMFLSDRRQPVVMLTRFDKWNWTSRWHFIFQSDVFVPRETRRANGRRELLINGGCFPSAVAFMFALYTHTLCPSAAVTIGLFFPLCGINCSNI